MPRLDLSDCICPICLSIFIEPVTMPCGHDLCMVCFKQNVQESNLCCPLCRKRISTWTRKAVRNKSLINEIKWAEIQRQFPEKVQNKLLGLDDEEVEEHKNIHIRSISQPGEIHMEYENELKKLQAEDEEKQKVEEEASRTLIENLQEEEQLAQRERQRLALSDEVIARELNQKLKEEKMETPELRTFLTDKRKGLEAKTPTFLEKYLSKSKDPCDKESYPYTCYTPSNKDQEETLNSIHPVASTCSITEIFKDTTRTELFPASTCTTPCGAGSGSCLNDLSTIPLLPQVKLDLEEDEDEAANFLIDPDEDSLGFSSVQIKQAIEESKKESAFCYPARAGDITPTMDAEPGPSHEQTSDSVKRSNSAVSCDSISQELIHFKPIDKSPRTPPKRLAGGRLHDPPIIRSTPRNISDLIRPPMRSSLEMRTESLGSSPIMNRRLSQLAAERNEKVRIMSKATSTSVQLASSEDRHEKTLSPSITFLGEERVDPPPSSNHNTQADDSPTVIDLCDTPSPAVLGSPPSRPDDPAELPQLSPRPDVPAELPQLSPRPDIPARSPQQSPRPDIPDELPQLSPRPDILARSPQRSPRHDVPPWSPQLSPRRDVPAGSPQQSPRPDIQAGSPQRSPRLDIQAGSPQRSPRPDIQAGSPQRFPRPDNPTRLPQQSLRLDNHTRFPQPSPRPDNPARFPQSSPCPDIPARSPQPSPITHRACGKLYRMKRHSRLNTINDATEKPNSVPTLKTWLKVCPDIVDHGNSPKVVEKDSTVPKTSPPQPDSQHNKEGSLAGESTAQKTSPPQPDSQNNKEGSFAGESTAQKTSPPRPDSQNNKEGSLAGESTAPKTSPPRPDSQNHKEGSLAGESTAPKTSPPQPDSQNNKEGSLPGESTAPKTSPPRPDSQNNKEGGIAGAKNSDMEYVENGEIDSNDVADSVKDENPGQKMLRKRGKLKVGDVTKSDPDSDTDSCSVTSSPVRRNGQRRPKRPRRYTEIPDQIHVPKKRPKECKAKNADEVETKSAESVMRNDNKENSEEINLHELQNEDKLCDDQVRTREKSPSRVVSKSIKTSKNNSKQLKQEENEELEYSPTAASAIKVISSKFRRKEESVRKNKTKSTRKGSSAVNSAKGKSSIQTRLNFTALSLSRDSEDDFQVEKPGKQLIMSVNSNGLDTESSGPKHNQSQKRGRCASGKSSGGKQGTLQAFVSSQHCVSKASQPSDKDSEHEQNPPAKRRRKCSVSASQDSGCSNHSSALLEDFPGLHSVRLERSDFLSDLEYSDYVEEQDRLFASKLQADYDMESKYRLNALRHKGSDGEYELRRGRGQKESVSCWCK